MMSKYFTSKGNIGKSNSPQPAVLSPEYQKEITEFLKLSEFYLQKKSENYLKEDFLQETKNFLDELESEVGHQQGEVLNQTHSVFDYLHYLRAVVLQIVSSTEFRDDLIDFAESLQAHLDKDFEPIIDIARTTTEYGVDVTEGTLSDFEKLEEVEQSMTAGHGSHSSHFNRIVEQFRSRFTKNNETKTATMGLLYLADCWQSLFTPNYFEQQLPETVHRLTYLARDLLVFAARNEENLVHDLEKSIENLIYHIHKKPESFSNWMKNFLLLATDVFCCEHRGDGHIDFWERSVEVLNDPITREDIFRFFSASINLLKVINSNDNVQYAWKNSLMRLMRIKVQTEEMREEIVKKLSNITKLPLPPIIFSDDEFLYQLIDPILFFSNLMPSSFSCQSEGDFLTIKMESVEGNLENVKCKSIRKDLPLVTDEVSLNAVLNFEVEVSIGGGDRQPFNLNSMKCTINSLEVKGDIAVPNERLQLALQSMIERTIMEVAQDTSSVAKQFYDTIYEAASTSQTQPAR